MGAVKKGVVVGIDPSYTRTGMVAWNGKVVCSAIAFQRIQPGPLRLLRAAKLFTSHFKAIQAAWPISLAVIEDAAYGSPNRVVVGKLKEMSGVYKLVLEATSTDYLEVSPTFIKRYICGTGKAEKYEVARELDRRYHITFKEDDGFDLSDAAALAVWGWEKRFGRK